MKLARVIRHVVGARSAARRAFTPEVMRAIAEAIRAGESRHQGEIRFAVEAALPLSYLRRGAVPRERALMVFSKLRVWDTEHNTGVLVYVDFADHDVEIVADRGIARRVGAERWEGICRAIEADFRAGRWREGAVAGIDAIHDALATVVPAAGGPANELPDAPVML